MTEYGFWFEMHSGIRWLIVLIFAATLIKFTYGQVRGATFDSIDARLLSLYSSLLGIQFILGVVLIFWRMSLGNMPTSRWWHMLFMFVAVAVSGMTAARVRRQDDSQVKYRIGLIGVGLSALLIVLGVFMVGGW